jgi:hypothetical protein
LSLTEVLIAMGILSIGLLGVAAVFPVGSFYMQKAEIADRGSAIAQSVMSDIISRGMLNPRAWLVIMPYTSSPSPLNVTFPSDGKFSLGAQRGSFSRPLGLTLNEALSQPTAATDSTLLTRQFGSAYVIDPLGISVMATKYYNPTAGKILHGPAAIFPASAYNAFSYYYAYPGWPSSAWTPWSGGRGSTSDGYMWPIRRVTLRSPATGYQLDTATAEHFFRGSDDLAYDFPPRDDRPAIQNWDKNGLTPLARQWTGDYSWIVTVAPTTNAARNGMASNPEGFAYDVSVIVFYKRVLPDSVDSTYLALGSQNAAFLSAMGANERAVKANVVSTGLDGGELLLTDLDDYRDSSNNAKSNAFENLRTSQWIMLCGPHPDSNAYLDQQSQTWKGEPRFVLNWYQVVATDEPTPTVYGYDSSKSQRVVALRGPQWPWQPTSTQNAAANDLCVAICRGAVAVHTKTIRLEKAGDVSFGSAGNPSTTASPNNNRPY